jgi:hypothetical protein
MRIDNYFFHSFILKFYEKYYQNTSASATEKIKADGRNTALHISVFCFSMIG